jgi:class 3 adenylate cyclase
MNPTEPGGSFVENDQKEATITPSTASKDGPLQTTNLIHPPPQGKGAGEVSGRLGRYDVLRPLGTGGMATVYLARDTDLDRLVALKVPHLEARFNPQVLERFQREARAAALLRHPNICPVFDAGRIEGIPYLTMAYIEGRTLAVEMDRYRADGPEAVVALVHTLALALADAHSQGVIHRDLKPSNVMITPEGAPVLMDFGLARRVGQVEERLTQEGLALGTPAYMPPEQVSGDVDAMGPASDIYSLGVILYELLTGQLPFTGSVTAVLAQIVHDNPPRPAQIIRGLDLGLDRICTIALAKAPGDRYASMPDLAEAMAAWREGPGRAGVSLAGQELEALAIQGLDHLRTWGWGTGLKKMRGQLRAAPTPPMQQAWQRLIDTVVGRLEPAEDLRGLTVWPALSGWLDAGEASTALWERRLPAAKAALDRASRAPLAEDAPLRAMLDHLRATASIQEGHPDEALPILYDALNRLGRQHFTAGRLLDTLGTAYSARGDFSVARAFYQQALAHKQQHADETGKAVTHGQLGRLYLDWGRLDDAEEHFQTDLRLTQNLLDARGEAQLLGHLGQVALARGTREQQAGRQAAARRRAEEAAGWLDGSVRRAVDCGNPITEGYARKDRAAAALLAGDLATAEEHATLADGLFRGAASVEGTAQVNRLLGTICRAHGRFEEATRRLRAALAWFEANGAAGEAARTLWELARTQRADGARPPLLTHAYLDALIRAETSGRSDLVQGIEDEVREVDHEAHTLHLLRRARGPWAEDLEGGTSSEMVTFLALVLDGLADPGSEGDPVEVLLTLNQTLEALTNALATQRIRVLSYHGDGLVAVAREARHAERAVRAALGLTRLVQERNHPRQVLGLQELRVRVALTTGPVILGEVGTARHTSFTMVGPAVSLAARLVGLASPGRPLADRATREAARDACSWEVVPRAVPFTELGPEEAWEPAVAS